MDVIAGSGSEPQLHAALSQKFVHMGHDTTEIDIGELAAQIVVGRLDGAACQHVQHLGPSLGWVLGRDYA